jgi:hypothetical protein
LTATYKGPKSWSCTRDEDGHRTYKLVCLVQCTDVNDGPAVVLACPGLPQIGQPWAIGNDSDPWAFITPQVTINPVLGEEPYLWYTAEFTATTKPWHRDQQNPVGDPLSEPPQITYTFVKTTAEAVEDRFGWPVYNSCWERLRGKQIEFDSGTLSVRIVQNLAAVDIAGLVQSFQTVNQKTMWGLPPRTIKLGEAQVERKYYANLLVYLTRSLTFECNWNGWDRNLLDEGTKVLYGQWQFTSGQPAPPAPPTGGPPRPADPIMWQPLPIDQFGTMPDPANPTHFVSYVDRNGNAGRVVLNGAGIPAGTISANQQQFCAIVAATNVPLSNGGWWVPIPALHQFVPWLSTYDNHRGDLVEYPIGSGSYWVCTAQRATYAPKANDLLTWCPLPAAGLTDKGNYDAAVAYAVGDFVRNLSQVPPGWIKVERYAETDFPTALQVPDPLP